MNDRASLGFTLSADQYPLAVLIRLDECLFHKYIIRPFRQNTHIYAYFFRKKSKKNPAGALALHAGQAVGLGMTRKYAGAAAFQAVGLDDLRGNPPHPAQADLGRAQEVPPTGHALISQGARP